MIGRNEWKLCKAEILVAMQEYVDKRLAEGAAKVTDVKQDNIGGFASGDSFTVSLEGTEKL